MVPDASQQGSNYSMHQGPSGGCIGGALLLGRSRNMQVLAASAGTRVRVGWRYHGSAAPSWDALYHFTNGKSFQVQYAGCPENNNFREEYSR
eukprot:10732031-Karenia_brevis.AAC.2